ncbi:MAG: flagellar hook-length control protein FliK [Phycisphaerae bacterium]|nr:flagellar hook-length control protein FliK [Phycisphaerae bacterium]
MSSPHSGVKATSNRGQKHRNISETNEIENAEGFATAEKTQSARRGDSRRVQASREKSSEPAETLNTDKKNHNAPDFQQLIAIAAANPAEQASTETMIQGQVQEISEPTGGQEAVLPLVAEAVGFVVPDESAKPAETAAVLPQPQAATTVETTIEVPAPALPHPQTTADQAVVEPAFPEATNVQIPAPQTGTDLQAAESLPAATKTNMPQDIPQDVVLPAVEIPQTPVKLNVAPMQEQVVQNPQNAQDNNAPTVVTDAQVAPEPAVIPPKAAAAQNGEQPAQPTATTTQSDPKPAGTPVETPVTNTNTTIPSHPQTELTSGRPESMPLTANVPPMESSRIDVEATASSTVARTAAPEINPNSGDSQTVTTGRPVDLPSDDAPAAEPTAASAAAATIRPSRGGVSEEPKGDANSSSNGSSDSDTPAAPRTMEKPQVVESPTPTPAPIKTPEEVRDVRPAAKQAAPAAKVAAVKDSSTGQEQASRIRTMVDSLAETVAPSSTTQTGATATTSQPATTPAGANLTEQIATHIQTRRDDLGQEMVVRLDPPELGKVRIELRSEQGELTGVIRADNPRTLAELQREAPALLQRLSEAGVQIKTLEMHMGDTSQQGRGEQSFAQAQNAYSMFQHNGGDGRGYGYHQNAPAASGEPMPDDPNAWSDENGQYISDSALNVVL